MGGEEKAPGALNGAMRSPDAPRAAGGRFEVRPSENGSEPGRVASVGPQVRGRSTSGENRRRTLDLDLRSSPDRHGPAPKAAPQTLQRRWGPLRQQLRDAHHADLPAVHDDGNFTVCGVVLPI